jgi:hypothetical protein
MRIANSEHESHAWRIEQVAPDFRLEDVWALPAQGGPEDFATLLEVMASLDPADATPASRVLFAIRWKIGGWLGWDDTPRALAIPRASETTLSARLPEDLRDTATGPGLRSKSFTTLYRTDVEWAAEISNRTVHAVMHLAWVQQREGLYRGQMGVYVKPRGGLGDAYMAAIAPFRHRIVYPALMGQIERAWDARMAQRARAGASGASVAH